MQASLTRPAKTEHATSILAELALRQAVAFQMLEEMGIVLPQGDLYADFVNCGERVHLVERFERLPQKNATIGIATNQDFEILGTNVADADQAFDPEGGVLIASHGASADSAILLPHLDTNQSAWANVTWGTDQQVRWGCVLKITQITSCTIWCGLKLTNTDVAATDNDSCYFRYQNGVNGGKFQALYSIGDADVAVDTGIAPVAGQRYRFRILIDANRIARFYIEDVTAGTGLQLVATSTALTDATDLIPYVGVKSGATAAKKVTVQTQSISRKAA